MSSQLSKTTMSESTCLFHSRLGVETTMFGMMEIHMARVVFLLIAIRACGGSDVLITIISSNEQHILPTFFGCLEELRYPKDRITLWIRSDHNMDDTPHMLDTWIREKGSEYAKIESKISMQPKFYENKGEFFWSPERYSTLISHKEEALNYARLNGIAYILFLDSDALLTNTNIIQDLINEKQTIIAPLLQTLTAYSNFWGEMDKKGYYVRSKNYMSIVERDALGTHSVALIHSAVMVHIEDPISRNLTFIRNTVDPTETIPLDDIIVFARSAQKAGIEQFVTNKKLHGYILQSTESADREATELVNLKLEVIRKHEPLPESVSLTPLSRYPIRDSLGVDQIYLINLERRKERLERMKYCFANLGIRFVMIGAVDGQQLTVERREAMNIRQLPDFRDPRHKRNLTVGEIGCFLSHYNIWEDIVSNHYDEALIFEDDIHFEPYFRFRWSNALASIRRQESLDFVYLGRKRLVNASEPFLEGTDNLVHVEYSYWTLSYYITRAGAQKLLDGNPLQKMVPVDEYIPIMFDKHPEQRWKAAFAPRTLRAASVQPLIVYPTHFTGEDDYFSDTEDSDIFEESSGENMNDPIQQNAHFKESHKEL